MLKITDLSFAYGKKNVLENFSTEIADGEIVAVMGPSGCGKTTLLRLVAGLLETKNGNIENTFEKTTFVFQEARLFPWLNVKENLLAVLDQRDEAAVKTVLECLAFVELSDSLNKYPSELSGGMKSRVALARALAFGGDLFLLDEPFAALDEELRHTLAAKLRNDLRKRGASALLVTHSKEDAELIADRILILS